MYQAAPQQNPEYWGKPAFLQKRFIGKAFLNVLLVYFVDHPTSLVNEFFEQKELYSSNGRFSQIIT